MAGLYQFGPFTFDGATRELRQGGQPVPLTPKDAELLLLLLRHADQVTEKSRIMASLWPQTHVTEGSLTQSVHRLRQALGDTSSSPLYVETVPKRGYRFIAPVHSPDGPAQEGLGASLVAAEPTGEPGSGSRTGGRKRAGGQSLLLLCLLAAGLSLAGYIIRKRGNHAPQVQQMKVMRLTNGGTWVPAISPDGKFVAYIANGAQGQPSVWIREVSTGNVSQLVPSDGFNYGGMTFSRDGNYVYYSRQGLQNQTDHFLADIYRIPVIGGAARLIASGIGGVHPSPDSTRLVSIRSNPVRKQSELIVINPDGSGESVIATRHWPDLSWGASWSPDGRLIAFCARNRDGDRFYNTVMAVPAEGGPEIPLTEGRWLDVGGALWLPDGTGLLFTAREAVGDPFQIYVVSYPGGEVRRVTKDVNSYSSLGVTADGKTLVAEVAEVTADIWVLPEGNSPRARKITSGGKDGIGGLAWTPDGRIVYATISRDRYNDTGSTGDKALWVVNSGGGSPVRLTLGDGSDANPAVTPDGRYVVFSSYRDGAWGIWRVDIDGRNPKLLAGGGTMTSPACSPDGRWVVFRSGPLAVQHVWRVPIEGGEAKELSDRNTYPPAFSPDGKLLAFFSTLETKIELLVIPATGGEPVKVFDNSPNTRYVTPLMVRWAPDGRLLTYIDNVGETSNIWGQPVEGGAARQLTKFDAGTIFGFAWAPDGRQLAVARGQYNRQIVLFENFR